MKLIQNLKILIIDGRFSEYIDGFRGTIEGNGSDYKNINFIKIYEIIGDAFIMVLKVVVVIKS